MSVSVCVRAIFLCGVFLCVWVSVCLCVCSLIYMCVCYNIFVWCICVCLLVSVCLCVYVWNDVVCVCVFFYICVCVLLFMSGVCVSQNVGGHFRRNRVRRQRVQKNILYTVNKPYTIFLVELPCVIQIQNAFFRVRIQVLSLVFQAFAFLSNWSTKNNSKQICSVSPDPILVFPVPMLDRDKKPILKIR
jgi:hypothetical protein